MDNQNVADLIIDGAGAAGVHAASLLKIKGLKSIILESCDRCACFLFHQT
jgi:thioredoxin reductase